MSKFCSHPWVGLDISPQGEFKPCCKFSTVVSRNISDYQNSELMNRVREQFIKGEQPAECERCWRDETAGIKSKRELDFTYTFDEVTPDLTSIKVLMLTFGNTCNLACRSCSSYSSSSWRNQDKKLLPLLPATKIYNHNRFYQDKKFMSEIRNIATDVIDVGFPGGEPFITGVKEHLEFLDFLLLQDPSKISLRYITNTTVFPNEEFWSRWSKFKKVDIQLSIDGIGAQFEYTRWPAKWSECLPNILEFRNRMSDKIRITVGHTVSIFTAYYLPEFLIWCLKNKFPKPYLGLVNDPAHYDVRVLPPELKQVISSRLTGSLLEPVAKALVEPDDRCTFDKTVEYIRILDSQRDQSFADTFPELYQLIGEKWAI